METRFHTIKTVGLNTLTASVNSWLKALPKGSDVVSHSISVNGESIVFSCVYKIPVATEETETNV